MSTPVGLGHFGTESSEVPLRVTGALQPPSPYCSFSPLPHKFLVQFLPWLFCLVASCELDLFFRLSPSVGFGSVNTSLVGSS